jgi:hypothetical protein
MVNYSRLCAGHDRLLLYADTLGLPESDGDAKVQWIERPNPEPELHPPDLAKRGVIGVVIDVVKTIVKAFQKKVAEEKDVYNCSLLLINNPSIFTVV